MIEPILALFEMQVEGASRYSVELLQAPLGVAPEALNAVDMMCASGKLVLCVMDSVMFRVADINESIIAAPTITMNNGFRSNATANNGLESGLRAVRHNLRIDFAVSLQQSEDRCLATGSTPALATHTARAEVAFINFNLARKWRSTLRFLSDALTNLEKDHRHSFTSDASQLCDICGTEIHRKIAQQLAEFLFGNSGTRIIAVSSFHSSSLAPR